MIAYPLKLVSSQDSHGWTTWQRPLLAVAMSQSHIEMYKRVSLVPVSKSVLIRIIHHTEHLSVAFRKTRGKVHGASEVLAKADQRKSYRKICTTNSRHARSIEWHATVVAIESSLEWCNFLQEPGYSTLAWAVILCGNISGEAYITTLLLPPSINYLTPPVQNGINGFEEIPCMDQSVLENTCYEHAVTMALIPFSGQHGVSSPCLPMFGHTLH